MRAARSVKTARAVLFADQKATWRDPMTLIDNLQAFFPPLPGSRKESLFDLHSP